MKIFAICLVTIIYYLLLLFYTLGIKNPEEFGKKLTLLQQNRNVLK